MAAFQIEAIGFRIVGLAFGQALFFCVSELEPQFLRYFIGDFVLNGKDVAGLAIVLRTPQLRTRGDIDQFRSDA